MSGCPNLALSIFIMMLSRVHFQHNCILFKVPLDTQERGLFSYICTFFPKYIFKRIPLNTVNMYYPGTYLL